MIDKENGRSAVRETFRQLATTVESDLSAGHLHSALRILSSLLESVKSPGLKREVNSLQCDYDRLLHYMAEGVDDPQRAALHRRFITKAYRVLQNLRRTYHVNTEEDHFAFTSRALKSIWKEQYDASMTQPNGAPSFDEQDLIFELIWISPQLNSNEERQLRLFLIASEPKVRYYMLSALSLALIHYFDAAKMRLLIEYSTADNEEERARATVGIAACCLLHSTAITIHPQLLQSITTLSGTPRFTDELALIQHHFCLYRSAERLRQKMEQDILPALIKASQERARLGFGEEDEIDLSDPGSGLRLSKETRKQIDQSAREMFQMFQEGVDVNLHTFTALKAFPFFRRIGHWLAPFDQRREEVANNPILQRLHLCDSDMYSMALLTGKISESHRNELKQMLENQPEEAETQSRPVGIAPYQNVIQCLFRLLRRSPWTAMWPDIFTTPPLIDNPILGPSLRRSPSYLRNIAATLLRHNHYEQAGHHLRLLADLEGANCELLCQTAFCYEQTDNYGKAVRYLQEALMLEPENLQALYHLQHAYSRLARYDDQLPPLLTLERLRPDDAHILTETGLCLMQLQQWEEAQKRFYKMEYHGQRLLPSMRAVAWCALRMKDYTTAQRYYNRIIDEMPAQSKWEDYLNAGHTCWLQGETKSALPLYLEYARRRLDAQGREKDSNPDALAPFLADAPVLRALGKSDTEISLMHDLIEVRLYATPLKKGGTTAAP